MARTKHAKSIARFGPRYGARVKTKTKAIESKQRKKQKCPYCKKFSSKRISKGLWECKTCKRKYALGAYYIE